MGVRYRYKPTKFRAMLSEGYPLLSTLGKSEFEDIASRFLQEAVTKNEWPELEVVPAENAEMMADAGYLFRCRPPVKNPSWRESGWLRAGTYQLTNEALDAIIEGRKNLAKRRAQGRQV